MKPKEDEYDALVSPTNAKKWWRGRHDFLKAQGYELRPRFRPGWTPSWVRKKNDPFLCEDGHSNFAGFCSTQRSPTLRDRRKERKELVIVRHLTSEKLLRDPRNHTVPFLDVVSKDDENWEFMVMPLLINFSEMPFTSVDGAIDFMTQMLEGLSFFAQEWDSPEPIEIARL